MTHTQTGRKRNRVTVSYIPHPREKPTHDCDGTEACCEVIEIYMDNVAVLPDDDLLKRAERMAEEMERFKEEWPW